MLIDAPSSITTAMASGELQLEVAWKYVSPKRSRLFIYIYSLLQEQSNDVSSVVQSISMEEIVKLKQFSKPSATLFS